MMHENEVPVPDDLARRLVDTQFPQYADLPLDRLPPLGTDHQLFRLGDELLVRLPRIDWAADQAHNDWAWLPRLAPHLPLEVPAPVGLGEPGEGYPFAWTVVPWIEGETPPEEGVQPELARQLGDFVRALRGVDPMGGPVKTGTSRGVPLAACDGWVREWAAKAEGKVDVPRILEVWEDALAAPVWPGEPAWLVGDMQAGNVLVRDGVAVAAIDFGGLGRGDPAVDLMPCWNWFETDDTRAAYREAVGLDDLDPHAWRRGRGWAIVPSISALTYYEQTAPDYSAGSRLTLAAVLESWA